MIKAVNTFASHFYGKAAKTREGVTRILSLGQSHWRWGDVASVVTKVRTGQPKNCGSGKTFLSASESRPALETTKPNVQRIKELQNLDRLWKPPSLIFNGQRSFRI
jgi:hypothetical protein